MSEIQNVSVRRGNLEIEIRDTIELEISDIIGEMDESDLLENMDSDNINQAAINNGIRNLVEAMEDDAKTEALGELVEAMSNEALADVLKDKLTPGILNELILALGVPAPLAPVIEEKTTSDSRVNQLLISEKLVGHVCRGAGKVVVTCDGRLFNAADEEGAQHLITALALQKAVSGA